jgi:hypothetical protein
MGSAFVTSPAANHGAEALESLISDQPPHQKPLTASFLSFMLYCALSVPFFPLAYLSFSSYMSLSPSCLPSV